VSEPRNPSRRRLFRAAGAAAVIPLVPVRAAAPARYEFFTDAEAAFVEAAVARFIPRDELGPGALEAGVPHYIDRQLAGPFGRGERLYRSGPFREGKPGQGYQLPYAPAQLFRHSIARADAGFAAMAPAAQDEYLRTLEKENSAFFEALLAMTKEGFFSDPAYGGNRGMAGWKLVGFPGAYANYYDFVDRHNAVFEGPPIGMDAHRGHKT
jgi:gluconate 2-dehydrogenase gamma chain